MNQRWTLHVRHFGPIQSADIDMHPFTMFVGPNNSGKSYLITLIWGFFAQGNKLFDYSDSENPDFKAIYNWLTQENNRAREDALNGKDAYVSHIGHHETELFVDCFNELLHLRKKEFLRDLFNSHVVDAERISISHYSRNNPISIRWDSLMGVTEMRYYMDEFTLPISQEKMEKSRLEFFARQIFLHMMFGDFSSIFSSSRSFQSHGSSLYLPSARTGFMLNFRSLASSTIGQGFSLQDSPKSLHTTPTIKFLQGLIGLPKKGIGKYYDDIIDWLESNVICGTFVRNDDVLPDFKYRPQESDQELALHVCSSLVTELAPLVLFLKGGTLYGSLIIEEPEAHLHPAAQRKVAQALVRLVNQGLPVWITTHSDIMFQQFNNLIALSHLPNHAETMGYEASDILDPKDAMAYQFIIREGGTTVEPLKQLETGFEAPSFNHTLGELLAETIKLHDLTDDLEIPS